MIFSHSSLRFRREKIESFRELYFTQVCQSEAATEDLINQTSSEVFHSGATSRAYRSNIVSLGSVGGLLADGWVAVSI